jgi:hypothetical protein
MRRIDHEEDPVLIAVVYKLLRKMRSVAVKDE